MTVPSAGMLSPGRTSTAWPLRTSLRCGCSFIRALTDCVVRCLALSSRSRPARMKATIIADDSK